MAKPGASFLTRLSSSRGQPLRWPEGLARHVDRVLEERRGVMAKKPAAAAEAEQASFVFQGTVKTLKAATMPEVPVSDHTVVVRVDRLIQAPEALSDFAGHEITVKIASGTNVKAGHTLIF